MFIAVLLSIYFVGANTAYACKCRGRAQEGANFQSCGSYWLSDAVFVGTATKISVEKYEMKVSFSIEKTVRGAGEKTIEISTSSSTASCGYPFKEGERYFVYARRGADGKLTESLCGPTTLLANAAADLEYAKEIEAGARGTRLYGSILEAKRENYRDAGTVVPLAGIEITATGDKNRLKTTTDASGFYVFKEIPSDFYRVTAKLPNNLRELQNRSANFEHRAAIFDKNVPSCDRENFIATSQGSISGKVIVPTGADFPKQPIELLPIDENGKAVLDFTASQSAPINASDGQFYFDAIPAGKYLLAINPRNCPKRQFAEYGRMFFPGAANVAEAEAIAINKSERINVADFQLLPPFRERWISGVVLAADKTPLSEAMVLMTVKDQNQCFVVGNLDEAQTDAQGRFRIKGYEGYDYKIRATALIRNQSQPVTRLFSKFFELPSQGQIENVELIVDSVY
jgi:hypothetical protein